MLFMASHITRRTGEVFYFRARVPAHLVAAYGKKMASVSLRTRDPDVARRRARERRVEFDKALAALDKCALAVAANDVFRGRMLHLSDSDITSICERFLATRLADDELERIKGISESSYELDLDVLEIGLPDLRRAYAVGNVNGARKTLEHHLKELGLQLSRSSPAYDRLVSQFQQTEIKLYEAILSRRRGFTVEIPTAPAAATGIGIDEVLACWKRQQTRHPKTVRSFEQAFEEFKSQCKAPSARLVKKSDAVAFRDALRARADRTDKTISKLMTFLRAAFQCALDDDLVAENPFAGVKSPKTDKAASEKSRLPFALSELQIVFSSRLYQPGFEPRKSLGDACKWLPLLGLFTGARLEELAQLRRDDIGNDPVYGAFICIRRDVSRGQRTKNFNSVRNLPVHPRLAELGFLDYVQACATDRLFPALRPDKYGVVSSSFSTWWGKYLDELGITDSTRVFHSFRHAFVERAKVRARLVPSEVREAIVGHLSAKQIEMTYGNQLYPLEPQVDAIRHIDWPDLDLPVTPICSPH